MTRRYHRSRTKHLTLRSLSYTGKNLCKFIYNFEEAKNLLKQSKNRNGRTIENLLLPSPLSRETFGCSMFI